MLTFINRLTGTPMYVEDSRREEYLAAGHKLDTRAQPAAPAEKPKAKAAHSAKAK